VITNFPKLNLNIGDFGAADGKIQQLLYNLKKFDK
jgi:hypothetical protein